MEPTQHAQYKAPSPLQIDNTGAALSTPECILLVFAKHKIGADLTSGDNLIYLGTSEFMQKGFNEWVVQTYPNANFSLEAFNLTTLVASVWSKTKTHVENELALTQNQISIDEEKAWQAKADFAQLEFLSEGRTGKVFTKRQSEFLIKATLGPE